MSDVTVYTQPGCRSCTRVIEKLEDAGLEVEVVNIENPHFADARTYVTQVLGAASVPVIVADGQDPIIGYDPTKLKSLIAALT